MFSLFVVLIGAASVAFAQSDPYGFGRSASPEEIKKLDLTVFPDGTGLPVGSGNAVKGQKIFEVRCSLCHGKKGEGKEGKYASLVGGQGTLASNKPKKTVGSYWPYATTLWDFINRAMPFNQPRTLPAADVYSVTAYVLFLNGIVGDRQELNQKTLPAVQMPNRNGFVPDTRTDGKTHR